MPVSSTPSRRPKRWSAAAIWPLLRATVVQWNQHEPMRLSASLAFYSVMSLAPLVILSITIVGLVTGAEAAQQQVLTQFRSLLGPDGEAAVRSMIVHAQNPSESSIASVVGLSTLLFAASQVFAELQTALNKIWEVDARHSSGVLAMIRERFFSFGLVLSIGLLLILSLVVSAALAAMGHWAGAWLALPAWMLHSFNFLISLVGTALLFALIFKYVPDGPTRWRAAWLGAVITACLFDIGKTLIGFYLGAFSMRSTYGAAGSFVALVIWVYYSSLIFFFGAELTYMLTRERAARRPATRKGSAAVERPLPFTDPARQPPRK
jgi:membrane protein